MDEVEFTSSIHSLLRDTSTLESELASAAATELLTAMPAFVRDQVFRVFPVAEAVWVKAHNLGECYEL